MGRKSKKAGIYVYVQLIHFAVQQKLTQPCKATTVVQSHLIVCNPMDCSTPGFLVLGMALSPGDCSNSCPLSWWCHPTISSSVVPCSSCPQSFPASGSFPVSWLFTSGGQSIGASASVLPVNIQGCFPLGLTCLISLLSRRLSRVFSNQKFKNNNNK